MVAISSQPPPTLSQKQPSMVSLGASNYSPFDLDMAKMGYRVIQYDASIKKSPDKHPNITFHKYFVGARDDEAKRVVSLESVIKQNSLDSSLHNILQCDIEDAEWEVIEHIDMELLARYFSQIVFELHNCTPFDTQENAMRLECLKKIRSYFSPIYTHFNNYGTIYYTQDGLFFCNTLEVSYIKNELLEQPTPVKVCARMDSPNNKNYPDIPVIFPDSLS